MMMILRMQRRRKRRRNNDNGSGYGLVGNAVICAFESFFFLTRVYGRDSAFDVERNIR